MTPDIHESASPAAAAQAAAKHVIESVRKAVAQRGIATLAVSGGSTPRTMFESLAALDFDWKGVHFFWVDERCVPPTDAESNYRLTRQALFDAIALPEGQVHRVKGELPPDQAVDRYVAEIHGFFALAPGELPRFDLVHLGMGADAHTASLFPEESLIVDRERVAASVYAAARDSHRVTLLPGVLLNARQILFLVTGADKSEPLARLFHDPYNPLRHPAQLFAREGPSVCWFIDRAAAAGLAARRP